MAFNAEERRAIAREMVDRLVAAEGPTHFFLPAGGIEEWDREGAPAHDPEGLDAFVDAARAGLIDKGVSHDVLACHINDDAFAAAVLARLNAWVAAGIVPAGQA